MSTYVCFICRCPFRRSPSSVKTVDQTCSKTCAGKKQTLVGRGAPLLQKPCLACGNPIIRKPSRIKRVRYCSRECANVLRRSLSGAKSPSWKGGYITTQGYRALERQRPEHRQVMEVKLGRKLASSEIVHHIDHNKLNNHPDNLVLTTRSEHVRLHFPEGLWRHRNANENT